MSSLTNTSNQDRSIEVILYHFIKILWPRTLITKQGVFFVYSKKYIRVWTYLFIKKNEWCARASKTMNHTLYNWNHFFEKLSFSSFQWWTTRLLRISIQKGMPISTCAIYFWTFCIHSVQFRCRLVLFRSIQFLGRLCPQKNVVKAGITHVHMLTLSCDSCLRVYQFLLWTSLLFYVPVEFIFLNFVSIRRSKPRKTSYAWWPKAHSE